MVKLVEVFVYESPLFEVQTEDGPATRFNFQIGALVEVADAPGGVKEFSLYGVAFDTRNEAQALVARIEAAGAIDLSRWYEGTSWSGYDSMWTPEQEKDHAYFYEYA